MAPLRLIIEHGKFKDTLGREVILRGINISADAKNPSNPYVPSHEPTDFYDGDHVNFHSEPFSKDEAHKHFTRLKRMGFNTIRYVFTWEAIEAAGPGKYDEEWIDHTITILRTAKQYGFYVFMDPHQDVWARFCGGSGAPMWTIYACGLNPQSFASTEAAIVQNTYPEPDNFPKMIWSTNYFRLAVATIFAFFFAGRDFAPKCIIDGKNIQDYLQDHFIAAMVHLARRIHEAGDLEDDVVFGWESMNEPSKGLIGYQDLSVIPKHQALKKGTSPTIWQALLTGSGRACEVDTWEMGGLGPYKSGRKLVDPHGEMAWLPVGYDESRYGYKRDPGWKLGECIWAQHGVWDPTTDSLLRKDYFAKNPRTGETIDFPCFTDTYFMDFYRKYRDAIRSVHKNAVLLLQGPTMELPPLIKGTADDEPRMAYAPHFYDGITLMTKKWNRTWNVDVIGVLRGRYLHPAFAIKVGETAIRNCFRDQLATLRQEGLDRMGTHPCVLTEFGIPYDMDDKEAYRTGNYSSQSAALDANYFAVEGSLMEGHTLWTYMAKNDHERGDQWNGEDLSIVSLDDSLWPQSHLPRTMSSLSHLITASSRSPQGGKLRQSNKRTTVPQKETSQSSTPSSEEYINKPADAIEASGGGGGDDGEVNPTNVRQVLTTPSITSQQGSNVPELTNAPGYRAAEAFVRPTVLYAAGNVLHYGFDLRNCEFSVHVYGHSDEKALAAARADGVVDLDQLAPPLDVPMATPTSSPEDTSGLLPVPTVVWLPEYHFPEDGTEVVEVSSGKWEIAWDDSETVVQQTLLWWHEPGEQTIKVRGLVRKHNVVEGSGGGVGDEGYYDQLSNYLGSCGVM